MGEAWLRAAFDQAMIGMALFDLDGRWLAANRAFPALLGYTEAELFAAPLSALLHPDDRAAESMALEQLRNNHDSRTYPLELRSFHKDGRALWLLCSVALVRDSSGVPAYFITQVQDITARKVAEVAQMTIHMQLERSNLALQEFASVAAHDLQEPLRKIQAFGDRLRLKHGPALGEDGGDYLVRMQDAAARMQRLISDLLTLSRISATTQPFVPVDLAIIASEVLRDLDTRLAQTGGQIAVGDLPVVEADPTQMRQLLQNLLSNALKFHRPGAAPDVQLRCRTLGSDDGAPDGLSDRTFCELVVADDGIGFDAQYGERIFGVFQRLHGRGEYEGTGIGLAICRTIVDRHGGTICAASAPGQGATFTVTLPVWQPLSGALAHDR